MRLSLWQGFSSNHSARFTVVGVFTSTAAAQAAAERLRQIVGETYAVQRERMAKLAHEEEFDFRNEPPTPPELAAAEAFGLAWPGQTLDWVWQDDQGNTPVTTLNELLFVSGVESELGAYPVNTLVERLGGRVWVDGYLNIDANGNPNESNDLLVTVTARAPEEPVAQKIEAAVLAYWQAREARRDDGNNNPPWVSPADDWRQMSNASSLYGNLSRMGQNLELEVQFFHLAEGLPALLMYLRTQGCTEITYRFDEVDWEYEDD